MSTTAGTNSLENDTVRANTNPMVLKKIDTTIAERIKFYATQPPNVITRRIEELEREWDVERYLEVNAASIGLAGVVMGLAGRKRSLLLSGAVMGFLLLHAVKGWCPPVPMFRRVGIRTKTEIDRERFALKILRGDFQSVSMNPTDLKENPADALLEAVKS